SGRVAAASVAAVLALCVTLMAISQAHAIELRCVEASKYKYLYKIFGDDRQRFAEHLQVDASPPPRPEKCRAAVLTGRIERMTRDTPRGEGDADKLLSMISDNQGWFTTLYLGSGGGSIGSGLRLGQLTRMFWLKTRALESTSFEYIPDFFA